MLVWKLKLAKRWVVIFALHRSPSLSQDKIKFFSDSLQLNLGATFQSNSFLVLSLGGFNEK